MAVRAAPACEKFPARWQEHRGRTETKIIGTYNNLAPIWGPRDVEKWPCHDTNPLALRPVDKIDFVNLGRQKTGTTHQVHGFALFGQVKNRL